LERTSKFMSSHRDIPAELRTRISDRAHELEQARSQKDRAAIDAATLRLNDVTAEAVNAVYVEPNHIAAPQRDARIAPDGNRRRSAIGRRRSYPVARAVPGGRGRCLVAEAKPCSDGLRDGCNRELRTAADARMQPRRSR
jgi:hypothetical protein